MVARFIPMGILANLSGNVRLSPSRSFRRGLKKLIQPLLECFRPAHSPNQPQDVMGYEEAVLPGIGLRIVVIHLAGVKGAEPPPILPCSHEKGLRIQHIFPVLGRFHEFPVVIHMAEFQRHLGGAPVVIGILERL